jgi:tape measure domain-containing protein
MAKKIEEIVVGLRFEGADKLDKLSSGFRELGKAIAPSDKLLRSARQGVLDYAKSLGDTEQVSQGVIKAFEALRSQATSGGTVYRQLSKDINKLKDDLKGLQGEYGELGRVAKATDAQLKAQFPASKPEAFKNQITALRRELDKLKISSKEYGNALTEITIRETGFGRAQARQGVIAGAQAVGSPRIAQALPTQELPNTLAALQQRIGELRQDFQNLDRTSSDYLPTLREINTLTREYTNATVDGNAARKNEIRDRIASLQAINAENGALRAQDAIEKSIARNARKVARRQGPAPIEQPMRPISALYQSISDVGMANIGREIEMMGNGYEQVAIDINAATKASNGSIASLQAQRSAWQQLRTQLDPASAGFKKTGREIELLDRRLEKLQVRQRRGLGPMGATQAAGAVISGGIFGGPEGAIGGAIGTAVGGVPGAFAGAAIGAQVGIMRQSLGTMASFTAEIDKQRIALRNVVGSQEQYNSSLQFIDQASRRLAIPQDQLNKQFTQLSASVIGAGGNVDAAKIAFNGIAAGIRGTGGSLADMQSAMLATSQVFSKGKVSAEELRQQIGERLPGAFTLFAQSIGKTPQELDKMLEKGEVGLNDFMTFVQALSQRYGSSAAEIAASSQAAGDRMQVTFARLREAIGRELQPIGAQFQEIFANFFEENEQAIVNFAKSLAGAMKVFADNAGLIAGVLKTLLGFGAIAGTAVVFAQVAAGVATLSAAIVQLGGVAGVASLAMQALSVSMAAIPVIGWIGAAVAGLALLGKAVYDTNDTFRNFVDNIGGVIANDFQYAVTGMVKDAQASTGQIQAAFDGLSRYFESVGSFIRELFTGVFGSVSQSGDSSARQLDNSFGTAFSNILSQGAAAFGGLSAMIGNWFNSLPAPIRSILGGNTAALLVGAAGAAGSAASRASQGKPERQGPPVPARLTVAGPSVPSFPGFPSGTTPGGGSAGGGKGGKSDAERAAEAAAKLEQQVQQRLRSLMRETELIAQMATLKELQAAAEIAGDKQLQARLAGEERIVNIIQRTSQELDGITDKRLEQAILGKAQTQILQTQVDTILNLNKIEADRSKAFDEIIAGLDLELKLKQATTEQEREQLRIAAERAKLEAQLKGQGFQQPQIDQITGLQAQVAAPLTDVQKIDQYVGKLKDEIADLTSISSIAITSAEGIGNAFAQSFQGLISGSMSAKEALGSFFKSVADMFLEMAAQIIAKQMTMIILQTILKALGAIGGGISGAGDSAGAAAFGGAGPTFNPGVFSGPSLLNANGNAFTANGIVPYAKGGIVDRPTMFKFAKGGAMQTGIMGEAGAEAVMPLKRGPDGKLGVQATGLREAMGAAPGSGSASPVLNMSFQSTSINGVEYVSRDQLESAMAETRRASTRDGAKRGMTMTLDRIQNSSSTRRKVGI